MTKVSMKWSAAVLVLATVAASGCGTEEGLPLEGPATEAVEAAPGEQLGEADQAVAWQPPPSGYFLARNVFNAGKCFDVANSSTADRGPIHQWDCSGGANQQWRAIDTGWGPYLLQNRNSGMCMVGQLNYGQNYQTPCNAGNVYQLFWLNYMGNGQYRFEAYYNGWCTDNGGTTSNGAPTFQYPCHGGLNQFWKLDPVNTSQCNVPVTAANGGDQPYSTRVNLGRASGTFRFTFETYGIKDRMRVKYQGNVLYDTGCAATASPQSVALNYAGSETHAVVDVIPNCEGTTGTDWRFTVSCP